LNWQVLAPIQATPKVMNSLNQNAELEDVLDNPTEDAEDAIAWCKD
jgi:hypothetical protein